MWGAEGKNAKTLDGFFDELGAARSSQIEAVSMDMGPAFRKSVTAHAPQAEICFDPFHVVQVVTGALNTVRREIWQQLRRLPDPELAKKFKGARWALLKNPRTSPTAKPPRSRRSSPTAGRCGAPTSAINRPSGAGQECGVG